MKKFMAGVLIGSFTGYLIRKMQDDGHFDCFYDSAHKLFGKSERNTRNIKMSSNM